MRLIDADALIRELTSIKVTFGSGNGLVEGGIEIAISTTNAQPTVDAVKRKRGEWIEENRRPKSMMFYCSECHRTAYDPQNHHGGQKRCRYAFCPNCGAEMLERRDDG